MSSPCKTDISERVWKDKLDLFFSQPLDQPCDSLKNNEATDETSGLVTTKRKTSKFLKFFKTEDNSENERASTITGENSSGDCEDDFRKRCFVNDVCIPEKVKISNLLRNGWDAAIKKQKSINLRFILPHACAVTASKRINSKMPSVAKSVMRSQITLSQNFNGNCIY